MNPYGYPFAKDNPYHAFSLCLPLNQVRFCSQCSFSDALLAVEAYQNQVASLNRDTNQRQFYNDTVNGYFHRTKNTLFFSESSLRAHKKWCTGKNDWPNLSLAI